MTGFGEMLASAVVNEVTAKMGSALWKEISLHWGFKDAMEEMKKNMMMFQAVLGDAEKKSFTDESIRLWLEELKSAAYDIEDMMCDFETRIPPNNKGALGAWLQRIWLSAEQGKKQIGLVKEMDKMKKRLSDITERRRNFVLSNRDSFDMESVVKERVTCSSIRDEIFGREEEEEELKRLLKQSDGVEDTSIISIVGLGGIGKTTLAKLLYNNEWVKKNFKQGWVYVSIKFDLIKIGRALLESFEVSPKDIPETFEGISRRIEKETNGKKYFIVLDDVWEEDGGKLGKLMGLLPRGIKGSKIIITTRNKNVAVRSYAIQSYNLKGLPKEDCWDLFSQTASISESEKNDDDLLNVGMEIVEKCGGIPLAIIALGYTMRLKKGVDAWKEVRDSDIWRFEEPNSSSFETAVLPSLKLSYYFMPSHLKLCFGYCSIYPKGYEISRNELIQQWIALGFIQPTNKGMSLEKCGEGYVDDLLGMSFLQLGRIYSSQLCMHDLMHDLARYVIGNELLVLDAEKDDTYDVPNHDYRYALLLNFNGLTNICQTVLGKVRAIHCRSCTFLDNSNAKKKESLLHTLRHAKYLRVFHLSPDHNPYVFLLSDPSCNYYISTFLDSIGKLKQLRYLYAVAAGFEVFPKSFNGPINLRYLCMSNNPFKKLHVSFGNLTKLQVLILDNCSELECLPEPLNLVSLQELSLRDCMNFRKLPDSISNSSKLQILDVSYCRKLFITPSFLSCLARLRKINMCGCPYPLSLSSLHGSPTNCFLVRRDSYNLVYDIVDLNKVDALEGTNPNNLEIACLENVSDPKSVANASLSEKSGLEMVTLKWTRPNNNPSIEKMSRDKAILENLIPPKSLPNLILGGYSAPKFPSWIMSIENFLPNLSTLNLENMKACQDLPPLGLLPNLSTLRIYNLPNLIKIDDAFIGGSAAFRRLRILTLDSLLKLKEWPTNFPNSNGKLVFTGLQELHAYSCPVLQFQPFFPESEFCCIVSSPRVLYPIESRKSSPLTLPTSQLIINRCDFEFEALPDIIQRMTSLKRLSIKSCNNLNVLPQWLRELTSLRTLSIRDCKCVEYLPPFVLALAPSAFIYIESDNKRLVEQFLLDTRFKISKVGLIANKDDILDRKIRYYDAINDDRHFDKLDTYNDYIVIMNKTDRVTEGLMEPVEVPEDTMEKTMLKIYKSGVKRKFTERSIEVPEITEETMMKIYKRRFTERSIEVLEITEEETMMKIYRSTKEQVSLSKEQSSLMDKWQMSGITWGEMSVITQEHMRLMLRSNACGRHKAEKLLWKIPTSPTDGTIGEGPFTSTVASYTSPVTQINEETHVSADSQQPSDGQREPTKEDKREGSQEPSDGQREPTREEKGQDSQQPSDDKRKLTREEKGKGLLHQGDKPMPETNVPSSKLLNDAINSGQREL